MATNGWTADEIADIQTWYLEGIPVHEIAERLKRPRNAVGGKLNRLGLISRREKESDEVERSVYAMPSPPRRFSWQMAEGS